MSDTVTPTPPGWYSDPDGVHTHQAYWDGGQWTGAIRSQNYQPPPKTQRVVWAVFGTLAAAFVGTLAATEVTTWLLGFVFVDIWTFLGYLPFVLLGVVVVGFIVVSLITGIPRYRKLKEPGS